MNELLLQGLSELGLDVSRAETLERFSSLLLEKNQVMNLTAITEPQAVALSLEPKQSSRSPLSKMSKSVRSAFW